MTIKCLFRKDVQEKIPGKENNPIVPIVCKEKTAFVIRILLFLLTLTIFHQAYSQNGYSIKLSLKPYKNSRVYLGYYYGKIKALADSAMLDDNSTGTFKGPEKLAGGIYFIVSPKKEILFELLIDKEQNFSISADSAKIPDQVQFTGSSENTLFQAYTQFVAKDGKEINSKHSALASSKNREDSAKIIAGIKQLNADIQNYRDDIEKKYGESLLATLFRALKDP